MRTKYEKKITEFQYIILHGRHSKRNRSRGAEGKTCTHDHTYYLRVVIISTHNDNREGKPFWETIFVSATHCGAGCTLGDIVSEWIVFIAGTTVAGVMLFASYVFHFALAWCLGIIFQYLAIVQMRLDVSFETA